MANRIKEIYQYRNNEWDSGTPIGADAENIDVQTSAGTTTDLQTMLGVDSSTTPETNSIQGQLNNKVDVSSGNIGSTEIADSNTVIKYDLNDSETSTDLISSDLSTDTSVVVMGGSGESTATMWSKFNRFRKRVDNKFKTYFSDHLITDVTTTNSNTQAYSTQAINRYLRIVVGYRTATAPDNGTISTQLRNAMPKSFVRVTTSSEMAISTTLKNVTFTSSTPCFDSDEFGISTNGALSFKKSGTYFITVFMSLKSLTSGDSLYLGIQRWLSSGGTTLWDSVTENAGHGSYHTIHYENIYETNDTSSAFFIGIKNNTASRGTCSYCRVIAIRLADYHEHKHG